MGDIRRDLWGAKYQEKYYVQSILNLCSCALSYSERLCLSTTPHSIQGCNLDLIT